MEDKDRKKIRNELISNINKGLLGIIILGIIAWGALTIHCIEMVLRPSQLISSYLTEKGMLGEHSIVRIAKSPNGDFFFSNGSIKNNKKQTLKFNWSPEKRKTISTEMSISKIEVIRDDKKIIPCIEFIFDQNWLRKYYDKDKIIQYFQNIDDILRFCYETLDSLRGKEKKRKVLRFVQIKISKETLEREPVLSQYFQFE
jgi:hypothetical protein